MQGSGDPGGPGSPYYRLGGSHRRTHILLSAVFEPATPGARADAAAAGDRPSQGSWSESFAEAPQRAGSSSSSGSSSPAEGDAAPATPSGSAAAAIGDAGGGRIADEHDSDDGPDPEAAAAAANGSVGTWC